MDTPKAVVYAYHANVELHCICGRVSQIVDQRLHDWKDLKCYYCNRRYILELSLILQGE